MIPRPAMLAAVAGLLVLVSSCGRPDGSVEVITGNDAIVRFQDRTYLPLGTDLTSIRREGLAPLGIAAEANRAVYPDRTMYLLKGVDPAVAFVMSIDTGDLVVLVREDIQFQFQPVLCRYWDQKVAPCLPPPPSSPGPS